MSLDPRFFGFWQTLDRIRVGDGVGFGFGGDGG